MIKDKLHTITDEDAIEVAKLLLKSATSDIFTFEFVKISRQEYDYTHGCDAEESVDVFFKGTVINDNYRMAGWKDKQVMIKLIEQDRYHDHPHFTAAMIEEAGKTVWSNQFISNHIEAIEFLQSKQLV